MILSELLPLIRLRKVNDLAETLNTVKKLSLEINREQIRDYQLINLRNGINNVGIPDLIVYQNAITTGATLATLKFITCELVIILILLISAVKPIKIKRGTG